MPLEVTDGNPRQEVVGSQQEVLTEHAQSRKGGGLGLIEHEENGKEERLIPSMSLLTNGTAVLTSVPNGTSGVGLGFDHTHFPGGVIPPSTSTDGEQRRYRFSVDLRSFQNTALPQGIKCYLR